ncbi:MAG: ATP phosphoribosyltransferase regulatory subunit [Alphaproteobacteria bacterium]|nr:ATP phosphoribosyltransferase regulatory subunit [Alphaproteobacteria bacterium]
MSQSASGSDLTSRALLPQGLRDVLPPDGDHETRVVETLMACFAAHGYERVKPPLVEFEQTLLGQVSQSVSNRTFRMMDPISQRMMALRPDMTLQVARIATTRLNKAPRPVRLSYAGEVMRVMGSQLSPEREFTQVGFELIGAETPESDAEVILIAAEAARRVGVKGLSIDLMAPNLVPALLASHGIQGAEAQAFRTALDGKDSGAIAKLGGPAPLVSKLLTASGPIAPGLSALEKIDLPIDARAHVESLKAVSRLVQAADPQVTLTVDAVENRGFAYHTGVSFSLFVRGVRGELGRGGRYRAGETGEAATGLTFYMDTVIRSLPAVAAGRKVFVPHGTRPDVGRRLREQGWVTVAGLAPAADAAAEAKRLGCTHIAGADGNIQSIERAA